MSIPRPAVIYYKTLIEGSNEYKENVIKFHAVISEGHEATNQITKFPVQTGFEISNHAIRKNRVVDLAGVFTNTLLENTNQVQYSRTNNSREMFAVMESLVQTAMVCKVVTNLGIYDPVVFTKFKTKQEKGSVDSMHFTILGEEVQVANLNVRSAPKELVFTKVSGSKLKALEDEFFEAGLPFSQLAVVKQANVLLGTDFIIKSKDSSGKDTKTTFECKAYDPDTGAYEYNTHTSIIDVFTGDIPKLTTLLLPDDNSLLSGVIGTTNCLLGKTEQLAEQLVSNAVEDAIDEYIKTPLGDLKSSTYGALQESTMIGGVNVGQTMMGFASDCVSSKIAESFGFDDTISRDVVLSDTETERVINRGIAAIRGKGEELINSVRGELPSFKLTETVITQISNPRSGPLSVIGELFR